MTDEHDVPKSSRSESTSISVRISSSMLDGESARIELRRVEIGSRLELATCRTSSSVSWMHLMMFGNVSVMIWLRRVFEEDDEAAAIVYFRIIMPFKNRIFSNHQKLKFKRRYKELLRMKIKS